MNRLFIVSRHPLFGEGIEELLRQRSETIVLGREQDLARALERITELQPDVVLFDCNNEKIATNHAVMQILRKGVKTRVIGLDMKANIIHIYTREHLEVREMNDLLKAVERTDGLLYAE